MTLALKAWGQRLSKRPGAKRPKCSRAATQIQASLMSHVGHTVAKGDTPSLDQQTLTKHLTTAAKGLHPNLRSDIAFAKEYESNERMRRAILAVRAF